ncbi:cyclic-di-AMP receptor [uncultured Clostridium sp.]|uniref:cyclic-di-AMP receptor n=1 Tax=uncultured Clostridium sp. TaxID=59620 RepID=UPI0025FA70FA|nr:cyclic-di-AMP receptor [uncultured Clostridium sp.]
MKLVIAIVEDEDSIDLIDVLTEGEYRVTKLATTGGFLKSGNTTLMVGVEEEKVKGVIDIIKDVCKKRKEILAAPTTLKGGEGAYIQQYPIHVSVGGATVFVIDIDQFIKI